jgi:hypothetical protein
LVITCLVAVLGVGTPTPATAATAAPEGDGASGAATDLYDYTCPTPLGDLAAQVPLEFRSQERTVPIGDPMHYDVQAGVPSVATGLTGLEMSSMSHRFSLPLRDQLAIAPVTSPAPSPSFASWGLTTTSDDLILEYDAPAANDRIGLSAAGAAVYPASSSTPVRMPRYELTLTLGNDSAPGYIVIGPPDITLVVHHPSLPSGTATITCEPDAALPGEPLVTLSITSVCRSQVFVDVPPSNPFYCDIDWMSAQGISNGYVPGPQYRPAEPVTRQAMSAFLYRFAGSPTFPDPAQATFGDVSLSNPFFTEIEWMADIGLSTGTPASPKPLYKPAAPVSRQAMAAFLYRAVITEDPDVTTPRFGDVSPSHPFYVPIQWMAEQGISTGTPASPKPLYKPSAAVSRQAMSAFLHRVPFDEEG